jgi:hypothetical protein
MSARSRFNDPGAKDARDGVRSLAVQCHQCRHQVIIDSDHRPTDLDVPFGPEMVCTKCGTVGADVRPNWRERGTW